MESSELPSLPGALRSHQPAHHEEAAGEGALPTLSPRVLHAERSQRGVELFHGHTALQILELLSSDGGFLHDAVDGCKEKRCGFFF